MLGCRALVARGEGSRLGCPALVGFRIERADAAEPLSVYKIILGVADPCWREDFAFVPGTGLLLFLSLLYTGLDDIAMFASYGGYSDLLVLSVFGAVGLVVVSSPDDV